MWGVLPPQKINQVLPAENWGTYFLLVVVYVWSLYKSMQVLARDRENEV